MSRVRRRTKTKLRSSTAALGATPRSAYLPYPELALPGPPSGGWQVADSNEAQWLRTNGAANKVEKQLWVPLESGAQGVAWHELGHVRFSPERLPRVRFPILFLQAVEDARINMALDVVGLRVDLDREQLAKVAHLAARDAKSGDVAATIVRAVASLGTGAAAALREEVEALPPYAAEVAAGWVDRIEASLDRARRRVGAPVAPFRVAHRLAKLLARDLEGRGWVAPEFSVSGMGCCHVVGVGEPHATRGGGYLDDARYERLLAARAAAGGGGIASGRMKVARPPLSVRQRSVLRAGVSRRRVGCEGSRITRPDRLALDGAIFERPAPGGSGTILVDTSGSMSLSAEEVEEIVRAAGGAAVVAIYSGRGDEGELRIVAEGDLRATNEFFEPFGGGNVVDLPALEWLAKKPEPRLWVSDGRVTGVSDEGCATIVERCREVADRSRIVRVDSAEDAVRWLGERARR